MGLVKRFFSISVRNLARERLDGRELLELHSRAQLLLSGAIDNTQFLRVVRSQVFKGLECLCSRWVISVHVEQHYLLRLAIPVSVREKMKLCSQGYQR